MINNHKYVFNPPLSFSTHNIKEPLKKRYIYPSGHIDAFYMAINDCPECVF